MGEQPEQLRSDIERTRAELNQDMDRLAEKMSPTKTMERTVGRVSQGFAEKTSNVKNTVLGTAAEGSSSVTDAANGVSDMARRRTEGNPLAVGLIAFGFGWLAGSLIPATDVERNTAEAVKDKAQEAGDGAVTGKLTEVAQQVVQDVKADLAEPAKRSMEGVQEAAGDAVENVRRT